MEDTGKYLIHATFGADGVVERSDVVGAVFGQTEGLLGDELDIRGLQESAKLGRIDVEVESTDGRSHGNITIASSLDRVETATLGAALETIERIGPCRATVEISSIEDVRSAKRRAVIDRATELLNTAFDEAVIDSEAILEQVRERIRVADITEYEGLPAGPNVETSDAAIVVEGRADVLTLLRYGIKNAIAVEGTNIPEKVADLTREKTVTAFLDGDRGGELIRRELQQIGEVDYVAQAPEGRSVEDLSRKEVDTALRNKMPVAALEEGRSPVFFENAEPLGSESESESATAESESTDSATDDPLETPEETGAGADGTVSDVIPTLEDHVRAVTGSERGRFLTEELQSTRELEVSDVFDALEDTGQVPWAVVIDGPITQRLLDVAAQRGVDVFVGTELGAVVKQPTAVRVRTFDEIGVVSPAE